MKKTSKKTKTKKVVDDPKLPEPTMGAVNVPFTEEELANYSQLLSIFAVELMEKANVAGNQNELDVMTIYTSRAELSALLSKKLYAHFSMGEPHSRDFH